MTLLLPSQITVENYKVFRQPSTLHLRPLTLLYGPNNSGKSAALRVLRLLADSVEQHLPAGLNLKSETLRGASFRDLLHKTLHAEEDVTAPRDFTFTLTWEPHPQVFVRTLRLTFYSDPTPGHTAPPLIVRELEATVVDGRRLTLTHAPQNPRADNARAYLVSSTEPDAPPPSTSWLRFTGLLADWLHGAFHSPMAPETLDSVERQLSALRRGVDRLDTTRLPPERTRLLPLEPPGHLATDGSNAADWLATQPPVLDACRAFFDQHLQRRLALQTLDYGAEYRFRTLLGSLRTDNAEPRDTDLIDSGAGPVHLMPVLVALERLRNTALHTPCPLALLLEEPEAHLHPDLQLHLAAHLATVAAQLGDRRLLIETHSEHLLLGIRLQIARGLLRPEDVALHWVHAPSRGEGWLGLAELDARGNLSGAWPFGAFGDIHEAARDLLQAGRGKRP